MWRIYRHFEILATQNWQIIFKVEKKWRLKYDADEMNNRWIVYSDEIEPFFCNSSSKIDDVNIFNLYTLKKSKRTS